MKSYLKPGNGDNRRDSQLFGTETLLFTFEKRDVFLKLN